MYQSEYEKALEHVKTAVEFAQDRNNIIRCENTLRDFERGQAMACLKDMIQEYGSQIDTFGTWVDGVRVVYGVPLEQFTDLDGNCVFFTENTTGSGPLKPLKQLKPLKSLKQLRPLKALRELKRLRPLNRLSWSQLPGKQFFVR